MNQIDQYGTKLLRSCAEQVAKGIITGHDWPNSQDELTRLQAAQLLREAADRLDGAKDAQDERLRRVAHLDMMLCSPNLHWESARDMRREKNLILYGSEYLPDHVWDDADPPECAERSDCGCGDDTCCCAK